MVKYIEFDSIDDYGIHIHSLEHSSHALTKLASNNYSKEIMDAISSLKREDKYYYVVINALGSFEIWGMNRNGDSFPRTGLSHLSLRSDVGTEEDYGYKTFEYHSHFFHHHVNKNDSPRYGTVVFSHWNPKIERVELIVGLDRVKDAKTIEALENGDIISVSMGARVKYDLCSICQHKAKTTKEYCKHLKSSMGRYTTDEQAKLWSKELNKIILPGTAICAINEKPKFFDISKVYVGAEPTAYVLGKVANYGHVMKSADIAEAYGVTDELLDKIAILAKAGQINKNADIDKEISGGIDGQVIAKGRAAALRKVVDDKLQKEIPTEDSIPKNILDTLANNADLKSILSTMIGLGIHPKPREFQRIVIIKSGYPDVADFLDRNNFIFDPDEKVEPIDCPIHGSHFNDSIAKLLLPMMEKRSCFPDFLSPRLEKTASEAREESRILTPTNILAGVAALFAGLKLKAMGMGPQQVLDTMMNKPWIGPLLGGGLAYKFLTGGGRSELNKVLVPAQNYEDAFFNTYFSGHPITKTASAGEALAIGTMAGLAALPAAYIVNSYNRKAQFERGQNIFPGADSKPSTTAKIVGGATALGYLMKKDYGSQLMSKIKSLK